MVVATLTSFLTPPNLDCPETMKVLVIGGGGREHALVWKLAQSSRVDKVYCAPGNGGIALDAECLPADIKSLDSLVAVASSATGPDRGRPRIASDVRHRGRVPAPGMADLRARRRRPRSWSRARVLPRRFMQRHRIPTAHYAICKSVEEVRSALSHFSTPIVVKADGLAAGKGVVIARTKEEAASVASEMLSGKMVGSAGSLVILEECLQGDELSFLVFSDGERVVPLVGAQDHKRAGTATLAPTPAAWEPFYADHRRRQDAGLAGSPHRATGGCRDEGRGRRVSRRPLLRADDDGARPDGAGVQLSLRRSGDATHPDAPGKRLGRSPRGFGQRSRERRRFPLVSGCVGLCSHCVRGYPGTFEAGKKIAGLEEANRNGTVKVFHAATSKRDDVFFTSGGRVLGVTARAAGLPDAVQRAYAAVSKIGFEGMHYRKDIAARALKK